MNNLEIFCICIDNRLLKKIRSTNYTPVGLGSDKFSSDWVTDKEGANISYKNKFYGEQTFHYWFWKNKLNKVEKNKWIGFCGYRRFWKNQNSNIEKFTQFNEKILQTKDEKWENYEVILGDKIHLNNISWIKIIKYGKIALIRNPKSILKKNRNIRFHFDMFHGNGTLDKAIDLLNQNDREDFKTYVRNNTSYNQGNMFICRSKELMNKYYETIFPWLEECEKIFGFDLKGYGNTRIYGFLIERFMPFWFNKYSKVLEVPIIYHDLNKDDLILKKH